MHALQKIEGLLETSPGVRSCMIEYDQRILPLAKLLHILEDAEKALLPVSGTASPATNKQENRLASCMASHTKVSAMSLLARKVQISVNNSV